MKEKRLGIGEAGCYFFIIWQIHSRHFCSPAYMSIAGLGIFKISWSLIYGGWKTKSVSINKLINTFTEVNLKY